MFEIKVTLDATPTLASLLEALAEAFRPTPLEDARTTPDTEPEAAQSAPEPDSPAKIPSIDVTENYRVEVRKVLAELLGSLIVKPAGRPVLVPESDKRRAIHTADAAREDFTEADDGVLPF